MISEKLQNAINEQITAEMWSSNLYLSMSFYLQKEGFDGFASWMRKQSQEELQDQRRRNAEQGAGRVGEGDEAGGRDQAGAAGRARRAGDGRAGDL